MKHADREFDSHLREPGVANGVPTTVSTAESDHADVLEQLSDYLDGGLSTPDAERVRQHLDGCERCQAFWRTLRKVVTTTRQLSTEELPEDVKRRLIEDAIGAPAPH